MQRGLLDNLGDQRHLALEKGGRQGLSLLLVEWVVRVQLQNTVEGQWALNLSLYFMLGIGSVLGDENLVKLLSLGEHNDLLAENTESHRFWHDVVRVKHFDHFDEDKVVGGFCRPVD